jgi:hypothetical protein
MERFVETEVIDGKPPEGKHYEMLPWDKVSKACFSNQLGRCSKTASLGCYETQIRCRSLCNPAIGVGRGETLQGVLNNGNKVTEPQESSS